MAVSALALQTAIYDKLTADSALMAKVSGVYDEVPENAIFPYIRVGQVFEVNEDSHSNQGLRSKPTLQIWSAYRGFKEALEILTEVDRVLDRQPLTVPGFKHVSIAREFHQALIDVDRERKVLRLRHIPVRYRVWLTEV